METKRAAINGLAIVGFITLVGLTVVLAGNAARFVPTIVNGTVDGLSAAVIGVTSIFVQEDGEVIVIDDTPTPSEEPVILPPVEFPEEPEVPATPPTPTPGEENTDIITQNPNGVVLDSTGLPDLVPVILETGKLVGGVQAENFVATSTLSKSDRIAIRFAVENQGTNASGTNWRFNVVMPTETTYIFEGTAAHVQNLNPGERIEYVIGFDRSKVGTDLQISVAVDQDDAVSESDEDNNGAFVKISVSN